jgi:hypothetical protein
MSKIQKLIEILSSPSHDSDYINATFSNTCVICGKTAIEFQNRLAELEYQCSGLCQLCQNFYFN